MKKIKHFFCTSLLLPSLVIANPIFPPETENPTQQTQTPAPQVSATIPTESTEAQADKFREFSGYIGVAVDLLPPSVAAQLPEGLSQGVLVKELAQNSPALNALQPFDVMIAYGQTPLHHPAQFIKLVRESEPTSTATIKVVRKGQILDVPVILGSQETPNPKTYNGVAINQIGEETFRAVVRFVGPNGNKQMRTYQGSRDEIFEQARNANDIPPNERQQLLYATQPLPNNNNGFNSFFPFGGNNNGDEHWMNPSKYFNWW